ncbi:beta-lactamase-like protein [Lineolata rhizophorae]|uniref:Beta-lactamase-like protein n=1 Tax=Lineolata rhizophorae TaxID=578093 RepID=A0A6A6P0E5_9PEZI|nr:beta-lactamase-like protein [Lineolata rhizophorae]
MAGALLPLPEVERLSTRVIRVLGGNPGKFTLQGTNTYLIGTGPTRILLDTGEGKPTWPPLLHRTLASERATLSAAILTHRHHDHISGVPDVLSSFPSLPIYKHRPADVASWPGGPNPLDGLQAELHDIAEGQVFAVEGATLRAVRTPGHTADHVAFVLAEEEDAVFSGDAVLGHGTAVFEDLAAYMACLEKLERECGEKGRLYPGHGAVVEEGRARVREYIEHRRQRERQVLNVLETGKEGEGEVEGWGSMEIVKVIYKDYPENLHEPAQRGVLQILDKLIKEGKVAHHEATDTFSLITKAAL